MRRKTEPNFEELMKLKGLCQPSASYRNMLDNIHPKCYVEASSTGQYGTVEDLVRNKYGIPVCIKVRYGDDNSVDYISVDRIDFWEPFDSRVPDSEYQMTFDEQQKMVLAMGYHWDEGREVYVNDDGDTLVW